MSSTDALAYVMAHAGASLVRDSVDKYILDEVASYGTKGALISDEDEVGGPGTLAKSAKTIAYGGNLALIGVVAGVGGARCLSAFRRFNLALTCDPFHPM